MKGGREVVQVQSSAHALLDPSRTLSSDRRCPAYSSRSPDARAVLGRQVALELLLELARDLERELGLLGLAGFEGRRRGRVREQVGLKLVEELVWRERVQSEDRETCES